MGTKLKPQNFPVLELFHPALPFHAQGRRAVRGSIVMGEDRIWLKISVLGSHIQ
jgi:hypothetical protein